MDRRTFVRCSAGGVAFLAFNRYVPLALAQSVPDLAIVRSENYESAVQKAIEVLGGISHFIKKGETVLVKPNAAWDRTPEMAANTHPRVVAAVVELCVKAGAGRVIVSDRTCHDASRSFVASGIEEAAAGAGAEVIYGDLDFVWRDFQGKAVKEWKLLDLYSQADKVINVPVVKHHTASTMSCAMKNWMGVIGGKRGLLHQDLHTAIADLATVCVPSLTVVDGTRALMSNGPTGGDTEDVKWHHMVAAGYDQVACDSWASGLLGHEWTDVDHLLQASRREIGQPDLTRVKVEKIDL